jgi:hypothetical protein
MAAYLAEAKTPVQPSREVPITMAGDRWSQNHIEGEAALKTSNNKEVEFWEQQRETEPTRNE